MLKQSLGFKWGIEQDHAFIEIKERLCGAPLLALLDFSKTFEIECDTLGICIGAVSMQETWQHYLWLKEFVIHTNQ